MEGCPLSLRIGKQVTGHLLDNHGADTARHGTNARNGSDGALGEHVTYGREDVGAPGLVSCTGKADEDGRPPGAHGTQRLGGQGHQREEGEDEHGQHTAGVWMHPLLLHKELGKIAAEQRNHRHNGVQGENKALSQRRAGRCVELVLEVGRRPEEEEPPHAVGEEFANRKAPGLLVRKALQHGDGLFLCGGSLFGTSLSGIVLMDIGKLLLVHMFTLFRLVVHELPEEHPDEAQAADDDKGHFPAKVLGERRDQERSGQCAHGCTCIEDGSSESTVLLGEVLGRGLDGRREVTGLAQRQDTPAQEEEVNTYRRDG